VVSKRCISFLDPGVQAADYERMKTQHSIEPSWKSKPELCARCPRCKEVFPLGYNYCPECGAALKRGGKANKRR
jgi:rRNA maturation endonuclease Nob1